MHKKFPKGHYCYILESVRLHRTYVGYTVNPPRRIRQHNGEITGGSRYCKAGRPWRFVCVIGGFKTKQHALQFEYAIKHVTRVSAKVKVRSKSKNRSVNRRVAKLFTVFLRDRCTRRAPLNRDQKYKIYWFVDRYWELDDTVKNCRSNRRRIEYP